MVAAFSLLLAAFSGCSGSGDPSERVTFTEHVAPIVFEKCTPCHRPGESAPFSFMSYDDVERRAQQIAQVTRTRFMPPWLPEPGGPDFEGDRSLTDREIDLLRLWVKQGAAQGDPARLPPLPEWPEGWQLGEPDLVVEVPETYTLPAEGLDVYRNFVIPIPTDGTRWVRAVELRPGNKRIVHHAIVQIDRTPTSRRLDAEDTEPGFGGMEMGGSVPPDGHFIGWTPGKMPTAAAAGTAWRLDRGTDVVLQLHMLPTGKPETIRPTIGFHLTDEPTSVSPIVILLDDSNIDIPAGASDHLITDEIMLPVAVEALGLYPHAHYLGKTMEVTATFPDGERKTLIRIDDWDFNWQDEYRYVTPVALPAGTTVTMRYTYDNSADNERNPTDPPVRVVSGNRSTDEMGSLSLQVLPHSLRERHLLEEAQARHELSKYPAHYAGHYNLGSALLAQGRPAEAISHLRRATEIRPDLAKTHYNLGLALAELQLQDEADRAYREALRVDPSHPGAENNLGNLLLAQGKLDEAIPRLLRATELQVDFAEAHYNLANALLSRDRAHESIPHYREVLRLDPRDAMAWNNLAVAQETLGNHDEALRHWRHALSLDPTLVEAQTNLDRALAGRDGN